MKLTNLKLTNFRNYNNLDIKFSNNYNIIYGNNGEGKTNLVESIYLLALTKSFRVSKDEFMIKKGESELIVEGKIKTKVNTRYKINVKKDLKETFIDNNKQEKMSEYISNINVILFSPDDVFLIKEAPSERRKLINIEISKIHKEYLYLLSNYNKVLKMRNAYLKIMKEKRNNSFEYLEILTINLIEYGQKICDYRNAFIKDINKYLKGCYEKIFGYGNLEVRYVSIYKNKDFSDILSVYQQSYEKEILNGKTLFGVHHDDIVFYLDKNKLKEWGSVGQHKNSILSFKLAEIELLKEMKKDEPILILDDLFSELDNDKISNILNCIDNNLQVFITTTDVTKFDFTKFKDYKLFKIENENVLEEENGQ